jgi:phosphate transport system substrate-binding protein
MASAEGQQAASSNAANAPISDAQRSAFQPAIDAIVAVE